MRGDLEGFGIARTLPHFGALCSKTGTEMASLVSTNRGGTTNRVRHEARLRADVLRYRSTWMIIGVPVHGTESVHFSACRALQWCTHSLVS